MLTIGINQNVRLNMNNAVSTPRANNKIIYPTDDKSLRNDL